MELFAGSKERSVPARFCKASACSALFIICSGLMACSTGPTSGSVTLASSTGPVPTRSFSGPDQYPPSEFAAYGIVAFPVKLVPGDDDMQRRYEIFCNAFVAVFESSTELENNNNNKIPPSQQMVTVWPIDDNDVAEELSKARNPDCGEAIVRYRLRDSKQAIEDAITSELAGVGAGSFHGRGPFLLAWSPGRTKGQEDILVLMSDLSRVQSGEQAIDEFQRWAKEIKANPELWERGWSLEKVKLIMRRWADHRGASILRLLGI